MANVLFGSKPGWRAGLQAAMDRGHHRMTMAPLDSIDPSPFDAVVPLTLADQAMLDAHRSAGRRVRGLWPPPAVRSMCDDKLLFNHALVAAGLGTCIPALHDRLPRDPAAYPVILKARTGAFGVGCMILHSRAEARAQRALWRGKTHFLQSYAPGDTEYATHLLLHRGEVRFAATAAYHTGHTPVVRGQDHPVPVAEWITDHTPHLAVMLACLQAVNFTDGACAVNWRDGPAGPLLFEANPRFGASLARKAEAFIDAYTACVKD